MLAAAPRKVPIKLTLHMLLGGLGVMIVLLGVALAGLFVRNHTAALYIVVAAAASVVAFMVHALWKLRLLRRGLTVQGRVVHKHQVDDDKNSAVYYTFEYEVGGHQYRVEHRMEVPEPTLEDDPLELMVYLPTKPQRAYPVDYLPGQPTIDANGQLVSRSPSVWPLFVLPILAVVSSYAML